MIDNYSRAVVTGFGYTGARLCAALRQRGCAVTAIVRSEKYDQQLSALGCQRTIWDLDDEGPQPSQWMSDALLFHLAPPPATGTVDSRLRRLLSQLGTSAPAALILASTSGVYGDRKGEWVLETDATDPATDRARRRVDAELAATDFCEDHATRLVTMRIAGIYGPGRLPLERLAAATPLPPTHEIGFSNRIHVDDLVTVLLAAAERGEHGDIFNVADGTPSSTRDWFEKVAMLTDMAPPPVVALDDAEGRISPMFISFLRESRRLDVSRLREKLGIKLAYADSTDGIRAALSAPTHD